jgi:NitT/TauT family transport system substrate-binding protein
MPNSSKRVTRRAAIASGFGGALAFAAVPAFAQSVASIRIASNPFDADAQPYYIQAAGIFDRAHLNVEIIDLFGSSVLVTSVINGTADVGLGSPLTVAAAREQGIGLSIIAPGAVFRAAVPSTSLLLVAKNSPLTTAADLIGKTIATPSLRGLTEISVDAWLAQNGIDPNKANNRYLELNFATMAAALEQGRIDAALVSEPALTAAKASTRVLANPYAAIGKEWLTNVWFAREDWVEKNRDVVRAFVRAVFAGQTWANAHRSETAAVLERISKLPEGVVSQMVRSTYGTRLDASLMQPLFTLSAKLGFTKGTVTAQDLILTA